MVSQVVLNPLVNAEPTPLPTHLALAGQVGYALQALGIQLA